MAAGGVWPEQDYPGGAEIFVIEGDLRDDVGHYQAGSWARHPPSSRLRPRTDSGATLYFKSGHLSG